MKKIDLRNIFMAAVMFILLSVVIVYAEDKDPAMTFIKSAEEYIQKGDLASAEKNVKKALEINKDHPWALRVLARVYREQFEKTKEMRYLELARVEIEKSLKLSPNDAYAQAEAALIYANGNNKGKALEAIDSALKIDPELDYFKQLKEKIQSMP